MADADVVAPAERQPALMVVDAITQMQQLADRPLQRPMRVVVRRFAPGAMSGHGTTDVVSLSAGFDHYAGRLVLHTAEPLTALNAEQVAAIEKSVRAGGSWHAYQANKALHERISALQEEVRELRSRLGEAPAGEPA